MDYKLTDHIEIDLEKIKQHNKGISPKELEAATGEQEPATVS